MQSLLKKTYPDDDKICDELILILQEQRRFPAIQCLISCLEGIIAGDIKGFAPLMEEGHFFESLLERLKKEIPSTEMQEEYIKKLIDREKDLQSKIRYLETRYAQIIYTQVSLLSGGLATPKKPNQINFRTIIPQDVRSETSSFMPPEGF